MCVAALGFMAAISFLLVLFLCWLTGLAGLLFHLFGVVVLTVNKLQDLLALWLWNKNNG